MASNTLYNLSRLLRLTKYRVTLIGAPVVTNYVASNNRNYTCLSQESANKLYNSQPQQNFTFKRFKKKSKKIDQDEEESDDDDDLANENPLLVDDLLGETQTNDQLTLDLPSLRLDALVKSGFSLSRSKVEEMFYQGHIYVNGERAIKKSCGFSEGDEIDIFKCFNEENHNLWNIKRLNIIKVPDKLSSHGRAKVVVERSLEITIEPHDTRGNAVDD